MLITSAYCNWLISYLFYCIITRECQYNCNALSTLCRRCVLDFIHSTTHSNAFQFLHIKTMKHTIPPTPLLFLFSSILFEPTPSDTHTTSYHHVLNERISLTRNYVFHCYYLFPSSVRVCSVSVFVCESCWISWVGLALVPLQTRRNWIESSVGKIIRVQTVVAELSA